MIQFPSKQIEHPFNLCNSLWRKELRMGFCGHDKGVWQKNGLQNRRMAVF
jgi:hypothetical protein